MQSGINIVPLTITGDTISVDLKGLSNDSNAGWRACIVMVDQAGNEHYSDLFDSGERMTVSANGAVSAYLTVTGTPKDLYDINAFHKDNVSSYKTGTERQRYPYAVQLTGAQVQQSGGYSKGSGHIHANGGGWVADSASVADSVYVGPDAMVLGNATLTGNVRVEFLNRCLVMMRHVEAPTTRADSTYADSLMRITSARMVRKYCGI